MAISTCHFVSASELPELAQAHAAGGALPGPRAFSDPRRACRGCSPLQMNGRRSPSQQKPLFSSGSISISGIWMTSQGRRLARFLVSDPIQQAFQDGLIPVDPNALPPRSPQHTRRFLSLSCGLKIATLGEQHPFGNRG